jgi:hypothetical protein
MVYRAELTPGSVPSIVVRERADVGRFEMHAATREGIRMAQNTVTLKSSCPFPVVATLGHTSAVIAPTSWDDDICTHQTLDSGDEISRTVNVEDWHNDYWFGFVVTPDEGIVMMSGLGAVANLPWKVCNTPNDGTTQIELTHSDDGSTYSYGAKITCSDDTNCGAIFMGILETLETYDWLYTVYEGLG